MSNESPSLVSPALRRLMAREALGKIAPRASVLMQCVTADDGGESMSRFIEGMTLARFTDNGDGTLTWYRPTRKFLP